MLKLSLFSVDFVGFQRDFPCEFRDIPSELERKRFLKIRMMSLGLS